VSWQQNPVVTDAGAGTGAGGGIVTLGELAKGLIIAFSGPVQSQYLTSRSIQLLASFVPPQSNPLGLTVWGEVTVTKMSPIDLTLCDVTSQPQTPTGSTCNAVRLEVDTALLKAVLTKAEGRQLILRVEVHGDLIADKGGAGLDGNHLPPWLPKVKKTGDGVAGGLFESWFILKQG
jgi:hypothetical protein